MAGNARFPYVHVEQAADWGHWVYLDGHPIGHRKYDGTMPEEIPDEVFRELAAMLRERLGWETDPPKEEE